MAIGLRAIPVALIMLAGLLLWPAAGGEQEFRTLEADGGPTSAGSAERADGGGEAGPPLAYDRRPPQLFVQGTVGGPDDLSDADPSSTSTTGDGSGAPVESSTTEPEGIGPSTSSGSSAVIGSSTTARSATTRRATASPTTARSTTAGPTTSRPTTARPATSRPTTTSPPTTSATTAGGTCAGNGEFERIFRDDFNGSSLGGSWSQFNSSGNSNYGLRRPSANTVANGRLIITAQMQNGTLVSGGMSHAIDQRYGKFVVKVRTDNDPSQAMSGVVLTWPQSGVHPRDGENNIYETLVKTPNRNPFFTFIHKPYGSKSDQEYYEHTADGAQFQLMTMEWTPHRITIVREGPGGATYRDVWAVNETSANLIPDVAHHLSIQLDAWKHSIAGPVRMEVDFVEIYKYCG